MRNKRFASDNNAGIHPDILAAIGEVNNGHVSAYGNDDITDKAFKLLKEKFGITSDAYFVFTGTAANILAVETLLKSYQAIICAQTSHIHVDECGSVEKISGNKLLTVDTPNGKLMPDDIEPLLELKGMQHSVQPKVISITQPTELGTVYNLNELNLLSDYAHKNDLYLHIDGARLANAAAALNCNLYDVTFGSGADVVSFGGTKNGMMLGEAVLFKSPEMSEHAAYICKQNMQLFSKMRYISAQFIAYLENDLWLKNARHANQMTTYLYNLLKSNDNLTWYVPPEANSQFVCMSEEALEALHREYYFYTWDSSKNMARWMTAWDAGQDDMDAFALDIQRLTNV
jgi:threonine aldolase